MGQQKLLLPFEGQTVIGHIADQVVAAPIERTVVVTATEGEAIRLTLAGKPLTFVVNPDAAGDMLSSVRCGLQAVPAECTAAIVILGDQPTIRAALIADLVRAFHSSTGENRRAELPRPTRASDPVFGRLFRRSPYAA